MVSFEIRSKEFWKLKERKLWTRDRNGITFWTGSEYMDEQPIVRTQYRYYSFRLPHLVANIWRILNGRKWGLGPVQTRSLVPVADPGFPRQGRQPLSLGQKLHENKRNWTRGARPWRPLRIRQCPPTAFHPHRDPSSALLESDWLAYNERRYQVFWP